MPNCGGVEESLNRGGEEDAPKFEGTEAFNCGGVVEAGSCGGGEEAAVVSVKAKT